MVQLRDNHHHNDEDRVLAVLMNDRVLARGAINEGADSLLSPVIPIIEDGPE